jgi:hypothetical protein
MATVVIEEPVTILVVVGVLTVMVAYVELVTILAGATGRTATVVYVVLVTILVVVGVLTAMVAHEELVTISVVAGVLTATVVYVVLVTILVEGIGKDNHLIKKSSSSWCVANHLVDWGRATITIWKHEESSLKTGLFRGNNGIFWGKNANIGFKT